MCWLWLLRVVGRALCAVLAGVSPDHCTRSSWLQTGGARRKRWTCALTLPALTLTLLYPEGPGCASQHFAPRLVAEALDLSLRAESGEMSGSSGSGRGGGSTLSATVRVVEVAEHLPFPAVNSPSSSVASCAAAWAGGWAPAEEMARVPAVLPAAQHIRWAAPTFAGKRPASGSVMHCRLACLTHMELYLLPSAPCVPAYHVPALPSSSIRASQATTPCRTSQPAAAPSTAPWPS